MLFRSLPAPEPADSVSFGGAVYVTTENTDYVSKPPVPVQKLSAPFSATFAPHAVFSAAMQVIFTLLMVLDGAATTAVVQDEAACVDVSSCDTYIKVGGDGEPTYIKCKRQGTLVINQIVDGHTIHHRIPARIVPGFGIDILPECYFLRRDFTVNKIGRAHV